MSEAIFAVIMPLVIFLILGIIYGAKPAYDSAGYTFLEQSFGAVSAVAICASGLMGLPQAISGLRELKILKRFRVTPVSPVFVLGVELAMYVVYCLVSLATLAAAALSCGVRLRGSLPGFLGSWALTMLSTLSVGLLVGGVAKDTKQASVIASILYFPMLLFSGTTLPPRGHAEGYADGRRRLSADAGHHDDEACVSRHRSGQRSAPDLRHARPDRPLHPPLPPLLPLGITQTPPPDLPAGVPCVYPRKFQKDFSKKLLRGEGTAEDAARRIQSRASLYMTEQYG